MIDLQKLEIAAGAPVPVALAVPKLLRYLKEHGTADVPHSNTYFLSHLTGVYRILQGWSFAEHVAVAGLFHSIYGTNAFSGFGLGLDHRPEIRNLIGDEAERLVYAYCALTNQSLRRCVQARAKAKFDRAELASVEAEEGAPELWDRFADCPLIISNHEFNQLLWIRLADILEQDARWVKLRLPEFTAGLAYDWRIIAETLGPEAIAQWDALYAGQEQRLWLLSLRRYVRSRLDRILVRFFKKN